MEENKYKIGYGKPPKETQFKEGESGNKRGIPRGRKNNLTIFNEILQKKVWIKDEQGEKTKISKVQLIFMQQINKASKGDSKAVQIIMPLILECDIKEEQKNQIIESLGKKADKDILQGFCKGNKPMEENKDERKRSTKIRIKKRPKIIHKESV